MNILGRIHICKHIAGVKIKFRACFQQSAPGRPDQMSHAVIFFTNFPFKQGYNPSAVKSAKRFHIHRGEREQQYLPRHAAKIDNQITAASTRGMSHERKKFQYVFDRFRHEYIPIMGA